MKWFKHMTKAHEDRAVETLIHEFGVEGYGLYFYCLEIIAGNLESDNITFELEPDAKILARRLLMDTLRVEQIMHRCIELGLFEIADNGRLICLKMAKFLDKKYTRNPQLHKIIDKASQMLPEKDLSATNTDCPRQTEIVPTRLDEIRLDKIREGERPVNKKHYLNHVCLQESNYQSMCSQYGKLNVDAAISSLDAYIANNDTRYTNKTDHDSIINKWLMRDACAGKIKIVKKEHCEPFRPLTDEERPSPERVHEILNQIPGRKYKEERMKKLEERRAQADSS